MSAPISTWETLVRVATLGTGSAPSGDPAPDPAPELASDLRQLLAALDARRVADCLTDGDATARRLLDHAAVLATYLHAGRRPAREPSLAADPAPADERPAAPPAVVRLLTTMLLGQHAEVIPEWLGRTHARGWRVPPSLLPALLDLGRTTPTRRAAIGRTIGERGAWLARHNPDWAWATARGSPDALRQAWDSGTPPVREAALAELRETDPAGARALLVASWAGEGAATRARLVAALATEIGLDDEPLLEAALDDRSREVRGAAADLLARLPGSALVRRMTDRARAALRYTPGRFLRGARLDVVLPGAPDSAAERDGIVVGAPAGIGERAWWLAQIVAAVPPALWTASVGIDATELVEFAHDGEWGPPLADAWARAAARHADAGWAEALLRAGGLDDRRRRLAPPRAALLTVLPPDRREQLLVNVLAGGLTVEDVAGLLAAVPAAWPDFWSERLGRAALAWLRVRATLPTGRVDVTLPALALALPTTLADEAVAGWPADVPPHVERAVARLGAVLAFRRALAAAFDTANDTTA